MIGQRWMHRLAAAATAVIGMTLVPPVADALPPSSVISAYSLAAPRSVTASGIVARAIVPAGAPCPAISVTAGGGSRTSVRMAVRPRPERTDPAFSALTVCSANVPAGSVEASIQGRAIPARMPERIQRLALLGDSGCRIASWQVQNCSDESAWPLARISAAVAADRPDAILFIGDFFYREAPCPPSNQSWCGGSPAPLSSMPFTDSAYGWLADAFVPMASMLAAAPLIVARGNHEACNRGGNGYYLYFDPRPDTWNTCAPAVVDGVLVAAPTVPSATYAVDLTVGPGRTLRLAIADSAGGNDSVIDSYAAIQRPSYQRAAALTPRRPGRESWLLTHRPIYGFVTNEFATPGLAFNPWSSADQSAAAWGLLGTFDLIFSSHLHQAEVVQLPGLPAQLILGNAGTMLDPPTGYPLPTTGAPAGPGLAYPAPSFAWTQARFGYVIATPQSTPGAWRMAMRGPDGRDFARCGLRSGTMYCRTLQAR